MYKEIIDEPDEDEKVRIKEDEVIRIICKHIGSDKVDYKTLKKIWPQIWPRIGFLHRAMEYSEANGAHLYDKNELKRILKQRLTPRRLKPTIEEYVDRFSGAQQKGKEITFSVIGKSLDSEVKITPMGPELKQIYTEAMKAMRNAAELYGKREKNIEKAELGFEIAKYKVGRVWRRSNDYFEKNKQNELETIIRRGKKLLEIREREGIKKPEEEFRQRLKDLQEVVDDMEKVRKAADDFWSEGYRKKQQPLYSNGKTEFRFPPKVQKKKKVK